METFRRILSARSLNGRVEEIVSIFIAVGRRHRLNNGCVMESVPPETQEINGGGRVHSCW